MTTTSRRHGHRPLALLAPSPVVVVLLLLLVLLRVHRVPMARRRRPRSPRSTLPRRLGATPWEAGVGTVCTTPTMTTTMTMTCSSRRRTAGQRSRRQGSGATSCSPFGACCAPWAVAPRWTAPTPTKQRCGTCPPRASAARARSSCTSALASTWSANPCADPCSSSLFSFTFLSRAACADVPCCRPGFVFFQLYWKNVVRFFLLCFQHFMCGGYHFPGIELDIKQRKSSARQMTKNWSEKERALVKTSPFHYSMSSPCHCRVSPHVLRRRWGSAPRDA